MRCIAELLEIEGLTVLDFETGERALDHLSPGFDGVVITDLRMPELDGIGLFNRIARLDPELPVVVISGHGDIATAVDLVRRWAYDFLSKPFDADHLLATVRRALDRRALALENRATRQPHASTVAGELLGESKAIEALRQTLDQLVAADIDVLITGESGTGKGLIESLLHRRSPRARRPVTVVDCRALSRDQAESVMFGHLSGAFPGAHFPRAGQLVQANAGTLLLDHIDGLQANMQTRLQQTLETGSVIPVGGSQAQTTHFRVLSTTSAGIVAMARENKFLPSLFYRLGSYHLNLQPLRGRGADAIVLFRHFLGKEAARLGRESPRLTPAIWRRLIDHDWPGNVRELRSFAVNVAVGLEGESEQALEAPTGGSLKLATSGFEAAAIRAALERHRGDIGATTAELNLPRKILYDKLARRAIDPAEYRGRD